MHIKYAFAMHSHLFLALLFVINQKKNYFEADHSPSVFNVLLLRLLLSLLLSCLLFSACVKTHVWR